MSPTAPTNKFNNSLASPTHFLLQNQSKTARHRRPLIFYCETNQKQAPTNFLEQASGHSPPTTLSGLTVSPANHPQWARIWAGLMGWLAGQPGCLAALPPAHPPRHHQHKLFGPTYLHINKRNMNLPKHPHLSPLARTTTPSTFIFN